MRAEHSTNEWELHPILRVIWNSHIQSAVIRYLAKSLFLIPNMTDSSARKEARRIICMATATPTLFKVKTVYKMVILRSSASTKQELVCGWTFVSIHFKAPHHGNIIINVCVCIFFLLPTWSFMQFNIQGDTKISQVKFQFGYLHLPPLNPDSVVAKARRGLG